MLRDVEFVIRVIVDRPDVVKALCLWYTPHSLHLCLHPHSRPKTRARGRTGKYEAACFQPCKRPKQEVARVITIVGSMDMRVEWRSLSLCTYDCHVACDTSAASHMGLLIVMYCEIACRRPHDRGCRRLQLPSFRQCPYL